MRLKVYLGGHEKRQKNCETHGRNMRVGLRSSSQNVRNTSINCHIIILKSLPGGKPNRKTCFDLEAINCFQRHVLCTSARLIHPSGLSGLSLIIDEKSCIADSALPLFWNESSNKNVTWCLTLPVQEAAWVLSSILPTPEVLIVVIQPLPAIGCQLLRMTIYKVTKTYTGQEQVDLPQVDLISFRVE